jgi:hypothetical protein
VRPRPVMTPVQQAPDREEPRRGAPVLRSFMAMLLVGGLMAAGIIFYIRGAREDAKKREQVTTTLESLGWRFWNFPSMTTLPTESEELRKDLADLPRIFNAAHLVAAKNGSPPRIVVIEGDPSGRGNGTHQIQYFFRDTVGIILHVYYDLKNGEILFFGVHNYIVPARDLNEQETPPDSGTPSVIPPSAASPASPATASPPGGASSPPPAEKVSEPPANPQ